MLEFIPTAIYRCNNPAEYYRRKLASTKMEYENLQFLYHCRNWTFRATMRNDGCILLTDTYFNDKSIIVNEEVSYLFEIVFDQKDVESISEEDFYLYDREDVYRLPLDSGGCQHPKFFKKKGAKINIDKFLEEIRSKIQHHQSAIEMLLIEESRVLDGTHYKLRR